MISEKTMPLRDAIATIAERSTTAWVYLPADRNWSLSSKCAILESEEVPPEHEDEPDAGVPEFAKRNGLMRVLPVAVVQDIVTNARAQEPDATLEVLFEALEYYYENDAFLVIGP